MEYPYNYAIQLRWSDMDNLGHVNNAKYFTYIESARLNLLQDAGIADHWTEAQGPILASASCQFKRPIVYPADVNVATWIARVGNSSFHVNHRLIVEGQVMASANTVAVWCDYKAGKPLPMSQELRELMAPYIKEEDA